MKTLLFKLFSKATFFILFLIVTVNPSKGQEKNFDEILVRFINSDEECGYKNIEGDTIIQAAKYSFCFSGTIKEWGIVYSTGNGFIGIDRYETILFEIFPFDNGPDVPCEGLFRIISGGLIGFADLSGQIIIPPQYECAYPFVDGQAKVSKSCIKNPDGEYVLWQSNEWFFIDRHGKRIFEKRSD